MSSPLQSSNRAEVLALLRLLESGQPLFRCERSGLEPAHYDPELRRCWAALEQGEIPIRFDWPQWLGEAKALEDDPTLIAQADRITLRKLLTCYLRQERFVAGTLAQIIENGRLLVILRRLAELSP